jgi:hypothetical protein
LAPTGGGVIFLMVRFLAGLLIDDSTLGVGNLSLQTVGLFQEGWIEPARFEFSVGGPRPMCRRRPRRTPAARTRARRIPP